MSDCLKTAVLATGLALTLATAPQAAPVSFDLEVTFLNGPLVGSSYDPFLLTFLYDDDYLTYGDPNDGDGVLTAWDGLEILFNGYNVEDLDVLYPDLPGVVFEDYIPIVISFLVDSFTLPELADLGIEAVLIGGDFFTSDFFDVIYDQTSGSYSTGATVIELAPIPLPAGLPLLAGGLGLMALAARRRARG